MSHVSVFEARTTSAIGLSATRRINPIKASATTASSNVDFLQSVDFTSQA